MLQKKNITSVVFGPPCLSVMQNSRHTHRHLPLSLPTTGAMRNPLFCAPLPLSRPTLSCLFPGTLEHCFQPRLPLDRRVLRYVRRPRHGCELLFVFIAVYTSFVFVVIFILFLEGNEGMVSVQHTHNIQMSDELLCTLRMLCVFVFFLFVCLFACLLFACLVGCLFTCFVGWIFG